MSRYDITCGDCIDVMSLTMADCSVDAIVTDPPYGIRFMRKGWDGADIEKDFAQANTVESRRARVGIAAAAGKYDLTPVGMLAFQEFSAAWATEAMRVLKPGGHLLSFASTRTYHRMVCGIEAAGFEIRDQIMWVFGSGFPKSHNLDGDNKGWGTALKPAHEPICVARKPLIGTVATNVLAHGTGALNVDGCRVPTTDVWAASTHSASNSIGTFKTNERTTERNTLGRWPANLIHDGSPEVLTAFPDAGGQVAALTNDGKSTARFFYCAKASRSDRNAGCDALPVMPAGATTGRANGSLGEPVYPKNHHPTVKPTDLMAYLCRLVTPPGGVVLDPFMGSGSTGKACVREGFEFVGIDMSREYVAIARARIEHETLKGIA